MIVYFSDLYLMYLAVEGFTLITNPLINNYFINTLQQNYHICPSIIDYLTITTD